MNLRCAAKQTTDRWPAWPVLNRPDRIRLITCLGNKGSAFNSGFFIIDRGSENKTKGWRRNISALLTAAILWLTDKESYNEKRMSVMVDIYVC